MLDNSINSSDVTSDPTITVRLIIKTNNLKIYIIALI